MSIVKLFPEHCHHPLVLTHALEKKTWSVVFYLLKEVCPLKVLQADQKNHILELVILAGRTDILCLFQNEQLIEEYAFEHAWALKQWDIVRELIIRCLALPLHYKDMMTALIQDLIPSRKGIIS